ncbi:MAG TPA: hypothetical protein VGC90_05860, partial [Candidatus Limnocylindrales bacterium]
RGHPDERRRVLAAGAAGIAIIAATYIPLAVSELTTSFRETRAAFAFLAGGGDPAAASPLLRVVVVALRIIGWPLTGLLTSAPAAALIAAASVVAILLWRARTAPRREHDAVVWFALTLAWSAVALAIAASSLATIVPGLPNDHYHAFLDPIVFVVAGIGAAALWNARGRALRAVAAAAVVAVVAFNVTIWPPAVAPDGGWPAARDAATRIASVVGNRDYAIVGIPEFKSADAYAFPLARAGRPPRELTPTAATGLPIVVVCDRLFEEAVGYRCGGPAESATAARLGSGLRLADRFDASARTVVAIYLPG